MIHFFFFFVSNMTAHSIQFVQHKFAGYTTVNDFIRYFASKRTLSCGPEWMWDNIPSPYGGLSKPPVHELVYSLRIRVCPSFCIWSFLSDFFFFFVSYKYENTFRTKNSSILVPSKCRCIRSYSTRVKRNNSVLKKFR